MTLVKELDYESDKKKETRNARDRRRAFGRRDGQPRELPEWTDDRGPSMTEACAAVAACGSSLRRRHTSCPPVSEFPEDQLSVQAVMKTDIIEN